MTEEQEHINYLKKKLSRKTSEWDKLYNIHGRWSDDLDFDLEELMSVESNTDPNQPAEQTENPNTSNIDIPTKKRIKNPGDEHN